MVAPVQFYSPIPSADLVPRARTAEHREPFPFCNRPAHQTLDFTADLHRNSDYLSASELGGELNARLAAAEIFLKADRKQRRSAQKLFGSHLGDAIDQVF